MNIHPPPINALVSALMRMHIQSIFIQQVLPAEEKKRRRYLEGNSYNSQGKACNKKELQSNIDLQLQESLVSRHQS